MSNVACKDCKDRHACIRHANCVLKNYVWDPLNCQDCNVLINEADSGVLDAAAFLK